MNLSDDELAFCASVMARAAHEAGDRISTTGQPPPPLYLFFARRDEDGIEFGRLRAAVLACAGYKAVGHWIGHGQAVSIMTQAYAIGLVAMSTLNRQGEAPEQVILSTLQTTETQITVLHPIAFDQGSVVMGPPRVLDVDITDPMAIPPLTEERRTTSPPPVDESRYLIGMLGRPMWLPLEVTPMVRA